MTHLITRVAFALLVLAATACRAGDPASSPASAAIPQIDSDLLDITVPRLQALYAQKRYNDCAFAVSTSFCVGEACAFLRPPSCSEQRRN